MWIQPAAGDAGGSLGAAILSDRQHRNVRVRELSAGVDGMSGALLGPEFTESQIHDSLVEEGAVFSRLPASELNSRVSEVIAKGGVVGWFQGRMEFGPRALGSRSILGDPRSEETQSAMNLRIKFRESFRPFAPSVLHEEASKYFDLEDDSPYMLLVAPVAERIRRRPETSTQELRGIESSRSRGATYRPSPTSTTRLECKRSMPNATRPIELSLRSSRDSLVAPCSSTPLSTSEASRSSTPLTRHTGASCEQTWMRSRSVPSSSPRRSSRRMRRRRIGATRSRSTDPLIRPLEESHEVPARDHLARGRRCPTAPLQISTSPRPQPRVVLAGPRRSVQVL